MAAGRWRGGEGKARGGGGMGGDGEERRRRRRLFGCCWSWGILRVRVVGVGGEAAGWRRAGRGEQSFGRGHALLGAHLSVTVYGLSSQAMLKIIERLLLEFYV